MSIQAQVQTLVAQARDHALKNGFGIGGLVIEGWQVVLSIYPHDPPLFLLSAMLHPRGRGSEVADWETLGRLVALVQAETGALGADPDPLFSVEDTDPNGKFWWAWRQNGDLGAADKEGLRELVLEISDP